MTVVEWIILAVLAIGVLCAWAYAIIEVRRERRAHADRANVAEWEEITAHELGEIEASIAGLVRVVVAAHRVEEPKNALLAAVKKNLASNVEYHFLVSESRAEAEINGWVQVFLAIAHVVQTETGSHFKPHDLIRISNFAFDWRDTPHVFYQSETPGGQFATIAFRGNQIDEGIAERYTRLPGWLAYSLAKLIFSDAPHPLAVQRPEFSVAPVIEGASHASEPTETISNE